MKYKAILPIVLVSISSVLAFPRPNARYIAPAPVAATGSTRCIEPNVGPNEWPHFIDCEGTGQDGEFQPGIKVPVRFRDNGDGTVRDNLTGIIWLKNWISLLTPQDDPYSDDPDDGSLEPNSWAKNLRYISTLADGVQGLTDGSKPGDWRLPTIKEAQSLFDYSLAGEPHQHPNLAPGAPFWVRYQRHHSNAWYWTSTVDAYGGVWAFNVFSGGQGSGSPSTRKVFSWAVRDPYDIQPEPSN